MHGHVAFLRLRLVFSCSEVLLGSDRVDRRVHLSLIFPVGDLVSPPTPGAFVLSAGAGADPGGARAQVQGDLAKLQLTAPVCTKEGEKVALSRRVEKHWRLIGWGMIQKGAVLKTDAPAGKA